MPLQQLVLEYFAHAVVCQWLPATCLQYAVTVIESAANDHDVVVMTTVSHDISANSSGGKWVNRRLTLTDLGATKPERLQLPVSTITP